MNTFGTLFRVSLFGESHGQMVGVIIDGCPPGIPLKVEDMLPDLARRKSGAKGTTPRKESDLPDILSGVFNGFTTGAPIMISFKNENVRSGDYRDLRNTPRPGHADFTARMKYGGFSDYRGGGHFSGRLTLGLVAAGTIAKKIIDPVRPSAVVLEAGGSARIEEVIAKALENQDSVGSLIECRTSNLPVGLGEPFFDSLESLLAHAVFSIPAVKGIEFGAGFESSRMSGSEMNDAILDAKGSTDTNHSGGINGGISNGNELVFRIAVKPASSIGLSQSTYDFEKRAVRELRIEGRHDACIGLRVPPVLEAVTSIVLADLLLIQQTRES